MFRRLMIASLVSMWGLCVPAGAQDKLPAAEEWVPSQAVAVLHVRDAKALLDFALQPELVKSVEALPAYKGVVANDGFRRFRAVVAALEDKLGGDWQAVLRRLTAGGVTFAAGPNQGWVMIVDCADAETPKAAHELLLKTVSTAPAGGDGPPAIQPTKSGGVDVWSLGPTEAHAILGRRVMIASGTKVLQAALDLRAAPGGPALAASPRYRQARQAAGADAAVFLYLNTAVLKLVPQVAAALAGDGNPLTSLLAAPLTEAVSRSTWLAAAVKVQDQTLTLEATADAPAATTGPAVFAMPADPADGALPELAVPRRIAAMSLHRDLRGFYAAKDQLFPQRTSGLIFFENMMGIFFTGRDLTDEVLAEMGPKVRLVVAGQKYDPAIGTPGMQLPAFALVLPLKNPDEFRLVIEEAWQKAVGLINFTSGQKAEPGLIIDRPVYHGTKYTVASYAPPRGKDAAAGGVVHTRYNFRPALAMPGGYVIFSSTDALAEDVMDALSKEAASPPKPQAGVHSMLEIDGPQVSAILAANREGFIRQNMVEKGNSREGAEATIDTLLGVVKLIDRVGLTVGTDNGKARAALQVRLATPAAATGGK